MSPSEHNLYAFFNVFPHSTALDATLTLGLNYGYVRTLLPKMIIDGLLKKSKKNNRVVYVGVKGKLKHE